MFKKIKSFFKNLVSCWRYEESLIKTCNRATPLHRKVSNAISCIFLVIAIIVWLCAFPSSAEEGITPLADVPSDLTGYTVTVPSGWTASAGYGQFSLSFKIDGSELVYSHLYVGYVLNYDRPVTTADPSANSVCSLDEYMLAGYETSSSFVLSDISGSDASNLSLIQWLSDNNATFTNGSEPEPDPLVTFFKGLYKVSSTWYNSDISTQLDGMTFYSLSEGDLFTALTVQNDELIFDDDIGDMHVMARNTTTGAKWIDNSGQFVYFINDESIPQSLAEQIPTLLEYIPDVSLTEYQRMQDSWYYGVQDGFTEGYNQASRDTEGTFLGNIFGGVFDALDQFQMFGQFSFLDFIKSIIGILALIWFLKLLAGG